MSLLDDVSIVVTPNGYKAGELYAVIPVPSEGAEQIVNGDFATDSDWTTLGGWEISGGSANCNGGSIVFTNASIIATKIYKVTYTVSGFVSGGVKIVINASPDVNGLIRTSNGTFTEYITSSSSPNGNFSFAAASSFVGSIDNVSVKEWTGADMDVTRETAATRVDENGLVNYAEVLGGEEVTCGDFECAVPLDSWSTDTGWSIGSGLASCDGTQTTFSYLTQSALSISDKVYQIKFSVTISAGTLRPQFVGGLSGVSSSDITSSGEYTIYMQPVDNDIIRFRANSSFVGSISNVSVKEVTRDNVPRIDYTGGGCPHILAEPQRRNLCLRSQEIDNATWTKQAVTVSANSIASPDGNSNADSIVGDGTSGNHYILQSFTVVSSEDYTVSIFAKAGTNNFLQVILGAAPFGSSNYCNFDLLNGNIGSYGGTSFNRFIEPFGNGWYRLGFTATALSSGSANFFPTLITSSTSVFLESNTLDTSIEIYGCSLELGSYPTSYIPTSGSTVTRNQDIFTRDGIGSLINSTEGVLFVEMAALANDGTYRQISLSDGTADNRVTIGLNATSNEVAAQVRSGGFFSMNKASAMTQTNLNKVAVKWKVNDMAIWLNGSEVETDLSGAAPVGLNQLTFDRGDGTNDFYGKVKQLQVYDTSLSDTQLAALTS